MSRALLCLKYIPICLSVFLLSSCGSGGPSDPSTAKCSDFTYQEDAQAYFRANNAKQLDGDNDGIACEALPHRPVVVVPPVTPPAATTAEGLYLGTTSTNRTVTGIVLDNGTFWVIYSAANNPSLIRGALQGTGRSLNGNFTSTDAKDYNLEGLGILNASVSASYNVRQNLSGIINYPSLNQNVSFVSTYSANYEITPTLAAVAGTYTGTAAVASSTETATLTIASNGALSGQGASGCRFSGSAAPHAKGNVYDVSVTFAGGVCSNGTSTVTGIGYFDATTKRLYGTALNSTRTNGFIFVGTKP